eukprot:CAMPEP_0206420316 /NCGR_PEP_ID=MMETSP0324_2-20121206/758_1 /ASSEMBLY_ACC=CAM_ASM_000836 /TAXON_ID=2866 /ORGANISM="Crypthecodinium cohnii, Strain Seligo" /LENGTH=137 /DNA_ID=CAMNT_0053884153 /DNA_START=289 /DNA_END=700 /DNA_ORIENTATION=-
MIWSETCTAASGRSRLNFSMAPPEICLTLKPRGLLWMSRPTFMPALSTVTEKVPRTPAGGATVGDEGRMVVAVGVDVGGGEKALEGGGGGTSASGGGRGSGAEKADCSSIGRGMGGSGLLFLFFVAGAAAAAAAAAA